MDDPCIEEEKGSSRQTGLEWLDPDGKLCVDELLLQSLAEEIRKLSPTKGQQTKQIQPLRCPACPFRMFNRKDQLRTHMQRHHTRKQQFCCSGTKLQAPTLLQQLKRGMESESLRASSSHEDGRGPGLSLHSGRLPAARTSPPPSTYLGQQPTAVGRRDVELHMCSLGRSFYIQSSDIRVFCCCFLLVRAHSGHVE